MSVSSTPLPQPTGSASYTERRAWLENYFDRTAAANWARLTSDAPVGRIRASVRAGRERMRGLLLSLLPVDLSGAKVLDAGCGTGAAAIELARRGAEVVAIDLSTTMTELAAERLPQDLKGRVRFLAGDMLDPALGEFHHVLAMDSLIHYQPADTIAALERLARRTERSMVFTFAPSTPLLAAMHAVGSLFPRGNRSPRIVPVAERRMRQLMGRAAGLGQWRMGHTEVVRGGFYTSQAVELIR